MVWETMQTNAALDILNTICASTLLPTAPPKLRQERNEYVTLGESNASVLHFLHRCTAESNNLESLGSWSCFLLCKWEAHTHSEREDVQKGWAPAPPPPPALSTRVFNAYRLPSSHCGLGK